MTGKELFCKDKGNVAWWNSVVGDPRYAILNHLVFSDVAHTLKDPSALAGADHALSVLMGFVESTETPFKTIPGPGLQHDLNPKKKE